MGLAAPELLERAVAVAVDGARARVRSVHEARALCVCVWHRVAQVCEPSEEAAAVGRAARAAARASPAKLALLGSLILAASAPLGLSFKRARTAGRVGQGGFSSLRRARRWRAQARSGAASAPGLKVLDYRHPSPRA